VTGSAGLEPERLTLWLRGRVQGVGMRWWVRARALERGLVGSAANLADGRVEVIAQGPRRALERFEAALRGGGSPGVITGITIRWSAAQAGIEGFVER
jgi:acylphosphatase